jgi:hypothetical protein
MCFRRNIRIGQHALACIKKQGITPDIKTYDSLIAVFPEDARFMTRTMFDALWFVLASSLLA